MSDSESFVDPVFLARFGLNRVNVLDYFLHPLNPFRTKVNTSNEILMMQGIGVGFFMQQGLGGINVGAGGQQQQFQPMTPMQAEEEYAKALTQINGEQYELLPPSPPPSEDGTAASQDIDLATLYTMPSNLYTIRHVLRTSPNNVKVLGIYYVVEGVIYKSPSVRALMKANITRTLDGIQGACQQLSVCARYVQNNICYLLLFLF